MIKAGMLIGIVGGIVAIYAAMFPVPQYFARLDGRISQLEEQVRSLAPTAIMVDRLSSRVSQIEEQTRSVTALLSSMSEASVRLDGRINQLEEKARSLAASSTAIATAVDDMSKKPSVAINPVLQKCVELAEEANTGQRNTALGSTFGNDVIKNAVVAMEKLGCGSKRP